MKRFHIHVIVNDLDASIQFYSTVFGIRPTVLKPDYVKWMVDDPRINFAISKRGSVPGIDHLGVQVDSDEELSALRKQGPTRNWPRLINPTRRAATPARINTGRRIRRGLLGRPSIRSIQFQFTVTRPGRRRTLAAVPRQPAKPCPVNPVRAARKGDFYEAGNSKCSVFVHRQFGAQHNGGVHPQLPRKKQIQSV
jgi:catechol 2,3-dioxygenase-like lactoylglutathione lyase family enzyme